MTTLNLNDAAEHMTRRFGTDWAFGVGATEHGYAATISAGSEAPDSPMVGAVAHGIDDAPAEALRQAFDDFGYRPEPPPNELDVLAASTDHLRSARTMIDTADARLRRARWLHYSAAVQLATAIILYLLLVKDVLA